VDSAGDEKVAQLFSVAQTALRNNATSLMSTSKVVESALAPPNALGAFATEATVVRNLIGGLVIASKHLLDALVNNGVSMEAAIPGDLSVGKDMASSGDDAPIRRALSLNFVQGAKSDVQDKAGNKDLLKSVLRTGSQHNIFPEGQHSTPPLAGGGLARPRFKTDPVQQQHMSAPAYSSSTPALAIPDPAEDSDDNDAGSRKGKAGGQSKLAKIFGENVSSDSIKVERAKVEVEVSRDIFFFFFWAGLFLFLFRIICRRKTRC
jgi:hypothetical protein